MARIPGAGAIVFDAGRLLLVQRGREPALGLWSVPGGHVEIGESPAEAAVRETYEETGLRVRVVREVGTVIRPASEHDDFVIHDFVCELLERAEPVAADDAQQARFVPTAELANVDLVPGLLDALVGWGLLPDA